MADEQEQKDASKRHYDVMTRLQTLRSDVQQQISGIINRYYDRVPSDLKYERDDRGYIRDDLRQVQRRIDETINNLH